VKNSSLPFRKILVTLDFPPEHGGIQNYLKSIILHTFSPNDMVIAPALPLPAMDRDKNTYPCRILRVAFPFSRFNKKLLLIPMFFYTLRHLFGSHSPTIFYAGNIYAATILRLLQILLPIQYHCYTYGSELLQPRSRHLLWKNILRHAQRVYFLSGTTQRLLTPYIDGPACHLLAPKISLLSSPGASRPSPEKCVNILSVGRLMPHKGHATLIDAFTQLPTDSKYHLTIAGDGPEQTSLMRQIAHGGKSLDISLITDANDERIAALYQEAHLFIFPSIDLPDACEGFGIVLLEAMMHQCAIITSNCGAASDVFADSTGCALTYPAGDAAALCQAITTVSGNDTLRYAMTTAAHALLRRSYVWPEA